MHRLIRFGLVIVLIGVFCAPIVSQTPPLVILEAEEIDLDRMDQSIVGSSNVKVQYGDYTVESDQLLYDQPSQIVQFPSQFVIRGKDDSTLSGDTFYYDLAHYKGHSSGIEAHFDRVKITGEKLVFDPYKITITNATFTTCDHRNPHFLIEARKLYLYPALGLIIAVNNFGRLSFSPIPLWIPTYIYGNRRYSIFGANNPFPRIGANRREGGYIKQSINYLSSHKSSGAFEFGYTTNLGLLLGMNHQYYFNLSTRMESLIRLAGSDGLEGGVVFSKDLKTIKNLKFKTSSNAVLDEVLSLFFDTQKVVQRAQFKYYFSELVNESRVDYTPDLSYSIDQLQFDNGAMLNGSIHTGHLRESTPDDDIVDQWRTSAAGSLFRNFGLTRKLTFTPSLSLFGQWHEQDQPWTRVMGTASFSYDSYILNPSIYYTKVFNSRGHSPFIFEQQFAQEVDEVGFGISQKFGTTTISVDSAYFLEKPELAEDNNRFRFFDITAEFRLHCFMVSLKWKVATGGIEFGGQIY